VAPALASLFSEGDSWVTVHAEEGHPATKGVQLKCTDQFLDDIWLVLRDNAQQFPDETSFDDIPASELASRVEAWKATWSESNRPVAAAAAVDESPGAVPLP
jgi:hypothetical protein